MQPLIDFSDVLTIDNTGYVDDQIYTYKVPNSLYAIITEIAENADSDFQKNGYVQIEFGGQAVTNQSTAQQEIKLSSSFTIQFGGEKTFIFLEPQSTIRVKHRVSTGSGTSQTQVTGMLINVDEFRQLRKKFMGD